MSDTTSFKTSNKRPPSTRNGNSMRSFVKSVGGTANLPSYAQPTISFSQHTMDNQNNKLESLKAGVSKSRPSSYATIKANGTSQLTAVRPKSKREPGFLSIFKGSKFSTYNFEKENLISTPRSSKKDTSSTPISSPNQGNIDLKDTPTKRTPSGSYRSPSLAQKAANFFADRVKSSALPLSKNLEGVMRETERLIRKVGSTSSDFPLYSVEQLKDVARGRDQVTAQEWFSFVDYHVHVNNQLQDRIKLDHTLIQNILELNNFISSTIKDHELELETAKKEIFKLKSLLELGSQSIKVTPSKSINEQPIFSPQIVDAAIQLYPVLETSNSFASNAVELCNSTPAEDIDLPPLMIDDDDGDTEDSFPPLTLTGSGNNPYVQFQNYLSPFSPFTNLNIPRNRARDAYDVIFQNIAD